MREQMLDLTFFQAALSKYPPGWEAITAISSTVAAVGLIGSLFYLSRQIKHSTEATRAAISYDAVTSTRDFNTDFMTDPMAAELYAKGWEEPWDLSKAERAQFLHIIYNVFKIAEYLNYQFQQGILDGELWEGWKGLFTTYLLSPAGRQYWEQRHDIFGPAFHDFYKMLQDTDVPRAAAIRFVKPEASSVANPAKPVAP